MMPEPAPGVPGDASGQRAGRFVYIGHPSTAAAVRVRARTRRARGLRAAGALGGCWLLAAVTVFVPLGHFFLVPGFLIAGPVIAWQRLHEHTTVLDARGRCPACAQPLDAAIRDRWRPQVALRCPACRREIRLEVDPAA